MDYLMTELWFCCQCRRHTKQNGLHTRLSSCFQLRQHPEEKITLKMNHRMALQQ